MAVNPNSLKNLKKRSREELAELGRKGGLRSGEVRRKNTPYRLIVEVVGDNASFMGIFRIVGFNHDECTEIYKKAVEKGTEALCKAFQEELDKKRIPYLKKRKRTKATL